MQEKRKTAILTDIPVKVKLELQQMEKKNKKLNVKRQLLKKKTGNKTKIILKKSKKSKQVQKYEL